ncbi:glycosyltransferase family 2 protein [Sphingomonas sp.]|uniref:glycosyltransferase family 2 protein n=1 Tax=Sphingomonas sp. TaxID=28214 RepID=UPI0025D29A92|nr:glycosyltransferase family 2 protein [Sphingomonas sp.]
MRERHDFIPADAAPLDPGRRDAIVRELAVPARRHVPFLLYGMLIFCCGIGMYLVGVLLVFPRYLFGLEAALNPISEWIVWYSGVPIVIGMAFALFDLLFYFSHKKPDVPVRYEPVTRRAVTVALTAYNDQDSIADAVSDFLDHPLVDRVIVVSNNSGDATFARAEAAGALTFDEQAPGYGRCVFRCLTEAARHDDAEFIVLCEGDRTFRAYDIDKLLAYIPHGDIVNGTRTAEPLRHFTTQLSSFMFYGNIFVGKLLEAKHLGRSTITDVGTTYKLCRRDALLRLLPTLDPAVNLEFNAHFLDTALAGGHVLIECPITFHQRVGISKGGNINNLRGLSVGLRMMAGIVFGWKRLAS